MSIGSVLAEIEAHNCALVEAQTWGHLAPEMGRRYPVELLFCYGEFGDMTPIRVRSPLPDSPWFFSDMNEYIGTRTELRRPIAAGHIYRFLGTYRKLKNGRGRFSGKTRAVKL